MTRDRLIAVATSAPAAAVAFLGLAVGAGLTAGQLPDVAVALATAPLVVALLTFLLARRVLAQEDAGRFLIVCFVAGLALRLVTVMAQLAIGFLVYGGQVDFVGYATLGVGIVQTVLFDGNWRVYFDPSHLGFEFTTMSTMVVALLVALTALVVGPNIAGLFFVGAPLSAAAAYLFYRSFAPLAPDVDSRRRFAILIFLFPSIAFWSVFLGKDVWVFLFMGVATYSFSRVLERPRPLNVLGLLVSVQLVLLMRVHIGGILAAAMLVALALRPLRLSGAAQYLRPVLRGAIVVGLVLLFREVALPAVQQVGVEALTVNALAERAFITHKGFADTLGSAALPQAIASSDPGAVARFLPLGMMTLLYRPFVWEGHNAMARAVGIENLFLLIYTVWRLPAVWGAVRMARRSAMLVFVILSFLMSTVVLSFDWNLGATQRHRTMVLPYLFMLFALPRSSRPEKAAAP